MYALFPLLLAGCAAGMLGAWLVHDSALRRLPGLGLAGWLLIAVLPLALLGLLARAGAGGRAGPDPSPFLVGLLGAAALLLLLAAAVAAGSRLRLRRAAGPARPGFLGPTLLIPAIAAIAACFLLSLLLALTRGTLAF